MKNFLLSSEQISIEISSSSGETVSVRRTGDPLRTNWVAPESGWGRVDGFRTLEIHGKRIPLSQPRKMLRGIWR